MGRPQAVKGEYQHVAPGPHPAPDPRLVQEEAVGHHAHGQAQPLPLLHDLDDVVAQERLAP